MPRILIIGHNWPEPKTTAAGHRMMQLLQAFAEHHYELYFGCTAAKTEFSEDLSKVGVNEVEIRLNHPSFDAMVKTLQPDVVLFDRFMVEEQFGWRVAENAPNALRILNTEDLHSLRDYRETAIKKEKNFTDKAWLATDKTKREMASVFRSDLTLVVSDAEEKLLINRVGVPKSHVLYLPFMLPKLTKEQISKWPGFEERRGFVCFGNGRHAPNVDAIIKLKAKLWPEIQKQVPDTVLTVYGAYLPQHIQQYHNEHEGFLVKGWVDDLDKELQKARLHLAPLRFGAGIKGKMIAAMQNGLPSITTPIGAEGMHDGLPWAGSVVGSDKEFITQAVTLYQDQKAWQTGQKHGATIINELYDQKQVKTRLFKKITGLVSNLIPHRANNFMGQLLQHHSLAATKFMGKWIEEKNLKK